MTLLRKQRDKCRTQAKKDRNIGPLTRKHVLEPERAHIPYLRRFRRGTSQRDMIDLLQTHHEMWPDYGSERSGGACSPSQGISHVPLARPVRAVGLLHHSSSGRKSYF